VYLRRLDLTDFRCYAGLELSFPASTILVVGPNAAGKSSLLEAIFALATSRSPHATSERLLIRHDGEKGAAFARARGEVVRAGAVTTIEVVAATETVAGGAERFVKRAKVNGVPRRALELIGQLNVVLFTPRDILIVDGAPADRRRYLDVLLCQVDASYCRELARYNRVLAQRHGLLRRLRDQGGRRDELAVWDEELATTGATVAARRMAAVAEIAADAWQRHDELTGGGEGLEVLYRGALDGGDATDGGRRPWDVPAASAEGDEREGVDLAARFRKQLAASRGAELRRGLTLVGPHRDDLVLRIGRVDARSFGSRGQQRTVALALKLAEAALMERRTGEQPVLLLDDVLSELDERRRQQLLRHVDAHEQTFLTATDASAPQAKSLSRPHVLRIVDGRIAAEGGPTAQDGGPGAGPESRLPAEGGPTAQDGGPGAGPAPAGGERA
jgi:DNA replication and repair protein RecF